jgi:Do/DeqQ family serine protease
LLKSPITKQKLLISRYFCSTIIKKSIHRMNNTKFTWKQLASIVGISVVSAISSVAIYNKITQKKSGYSYDGKLPANYANYSPLGDGGPTDFTAAAEAAVPAVVHIKTKTNAKKVNTSNGRQRNPFGDPFFDDFFNMDDFFGPRMTPEQRASGSGVLISADGNILTNNHVVEGADEVTVTLSNKKTYKATILGTDPSSDLAVIKIEGTNFPFLVPGNSDDVKLGQWVLALGYPLNLDCSVTAGIVSAKARSLGLNQEKVGRGKSAIESYIQHDAAVNKGNSGGALVNTRGELIGINAAIASQTGYYAGYSFTIPINVARKIANDLIKHGAPQRAFLGVRPATVKGTDGQLEIKEGNGVEVGSVSAGGAAEKAGIKAGDVITKINSKAVNTWNELVEQVASFSIGDNITIAYTRGSKPATATVTLKNESGNFDLVTKQSLGQKLGATFENLDAKKAAEYGIDGGVVVKALDAKGLLKTQNPSIKNGLVIIRINGSEVSNIDELNSLLEANTQSTVIQGFYPGYEGIYNFVINKNDEE